MSTRSYIWLDIVVLLVILNACQEASKTTRTVKHAGPTINIDYMGAPGNKYIYKENGTWRKISDSIKLDFRGDYHTSAYKIRILNYNDSIRCEFNINCLSDTNMKIARAGLGEIEYSCNGEIVYSYRHTNNIMSVITNVLTKDKDSLDRISVYITNFDAWRKVDD